ncbi:MAG: helix-turn-helix transcriptional regulator [Pseudomonadota bacterium]
MKRTDLGKWSINFRTDRDMLHKEMADALGLSASYLSSIEHGRKPIPEDWWDKVCRTFELTLPEASSLKIAIMRSKKSVTLPIENEYEARLLVAYQDHRSNLTDKTTREIENLISCQENKAGAYGTEKQKAADP